MKKTSELCALGERMGSKYDFVKEAQTGPLGSIVLECAEVIRQKMGGGDPAYQDPSIQRAMERARKALLSLVMELTSEKEQPL